MSEASHVPASHEHAFTSVQFTIPCIFLFYIMFLHLSLCDQIHMRLTKVQFNLAALNSMAMHQLVAELFHR